MPPTCSVASTWLSGAVTLRLWGMTRNRPPPSSMAFGTHVQLSRFVGRHAPVRGGARGGINLGRGHWRERHEHKESPHMPQ